MSTGEKYLLKLKLNGSQDDTLGVAGLSQLKNNRAVQSKSAGRTKLWWVAIGATTQRLKQATSGVRFPELIFNHA